VTAIDLNLLPNFFVLMQRDNPSTLLTTGLPLVVIPADC